MVQCMPQMHAHWLWLWTGTCQGSQLVCNQRQKVWAGELLPKFLDIVRQWRIILILLAKWWPWEDCKKSVSWQKNVCLASLSILRWCLIFLSFFTNCMLYPLFSGLLDLNGLNEKWICPIWCCSYWFFSIYSLMSCRFSLKREKYTSVELDFFKPHKYTFSFY